MRKWTIVMFVVVVVLASLIWFASPTTNFEETTVGYVDLHVHTAGLGVGNSGAFIGPELSESYKFPIYLQAFGVTEEEIRTRGDAVVLERIAERVRASKNVDRAVVLAMDGIIDDEAKLDRSRTQIYVPNDFLIRELPNHPELLFGASVNPYRPDALERLEHVAASGAVLLKWIPNIMLIDPADERITPFYRRMAALSLPLLTHAGQERSFGAADDRYGDPRRLALPLSLGVTVIAAHIATTGENEGEGNFERILPMFEQYPNLYADVSSLTQINKLNYLNRALQIEGLHERLVYGTDWPLQFFPLVSPLFHLNHISVPDAKGVLATDNQWDRDVRLKQAMGVPEDVFLRTKTLLER